MFMLLGIILAILAALLRGGSLQNFGALRIRWVPLIIAAFGLQFLIFAPFAGPIIPPWAITPLYILSMALLALWAAINRRIPGMLIMAAGLLSNFAAISANGGYMPVSSASVRYSGSISRYEASPDHIVHNSAMRDDDVRLWILTDIFAVPKSIPFANVYSIGDILLTLGAGLFCYRTIRATPAPAGGSAPASASPGGSSDARPAPGEDDVAPPPSITMIDPARADSAQQLSRSPE